MSRDGRQRVVQALRRADGPTGVHEIAAVTGLHENSVRFHLDRLVADGAAARVSVPHSGRGRPRQAYVVVAEPGTHGDRRDYRLLAEILAGALSTDPDATERATEAGRTWGRYLARPPRPFHRTDERAAVAELVRVLDETGFAPAVEAAVEAPASDDGVATAATPPTLTLRHCPFLEVATEHRDVVCAVHLGLMQGTLAQLDAPLTTGSLTPWATPSTCVATLDRSDRSDRSNHPGRPGAR